MSAHFQRNGLNSSRSPARPRQCPPRFRSPSQASSSSTLFTLVMSIRVSFPRAALLERAVRVDCPHLALHAVLRQLGFELGVHVRRLVLEAVLVATLLRPLRVVVLLATGLRLV